MEISSVNALLPTPRVRVLECINIIQDRFLSELAGILLYLSTSLLTNKGVEYILVLPLTISLILKNIIIAMLNLCSLNIEVDGAFCTNGLKIYNATPLMCMRD